MYISNPFGLTSIFISSILTHRNLNDSHNLLNCEILQELLLQLQWDASRNLVVIWEWSLTFSSSSSMSFWHIKQLLLDWNCCCSSSVMIKFSLKRFFNTFLQHSYPLRIVLINLKVTFSPSETTIGLVNLSLTQASL